MGITIRCLLEIFRNSSQKVGCSMVRFFEDMSVQTKPTTLLAENGSSLPCFYKLHLHRVGLISLVNPSNAELLLSEEQGANISENHLNPDILVFIG